MGRLAMERVKRMITIGRHVAVDGEVSCDEDLTIEGSVQGFVHVRAGTLVVAPHADVRADLRATRVVVLGHVEGAISAAERIELASTASVDGAISATQIVLAEGARFNGTIDMSRRTIAARVAEYRAVHAVES
jgi:cytoskeletal protein CcmA (bactofilin family)